MNSDKLYTLAFLFTTFPPEVSGTAQYNWERVQWFAQQEMYRVVVLTPDFQNLSRLPSVPSHLKEKLIIEGYPSKPWLPYKLDYVPTLQAADQIRERLIHYEPDLITVVDVERLFLFSTWHLPGRRYAEDRCIPYITEYRTDYYNFANSYPVWKLLANLFLRPLTKYLYSQFDITLASSKSAGKSLKQMGVSKLQVIPFVGIDISAYSPKYRNRDWLTSLLSAEEQDNQVLLYLGRLASEKRIDLLIEAFAKLKNGISNVSLIIAGDGPTSYVKELRHFAEQIPHIHFTGFIHGETKANLLASCDIFCSPSPYETFGRTIVEAMASGIPVVTVNSGAVAENVIHGMNGYLAQPNDSEELANVIEQVLISHNTEIIQQALEDAKRFSVERGCQNLDHYYQKLLRRGNSELKSLVLQ